MFTYLINPISADVKSVLSIGSPNSLCTFKQDFDTSEHQGDWYAGFVLFCLPSVVYAKVEISRCGCIYDTLVEVNYAFRF